MTTAMKLQLEDSLTGILSFTIPPLSVLVQSQKKYCHQVKRITVFVYFRMNLCQNSKYAIVFCFRLCSVKVGYKV